jgi:hypothetical protein
MISDDVPACRVFLLCAVLAFVACFSSRFNGLPAAMLLLASAVLPPCVSAVAVACSRWLTF